MKKITLFILISCFLISCSQSEPQDNQLSKQEIEEGWMLLFDGETTSGWRGFKMDGLPEGWTVEEGLLTTSGQGGDLGGDIITQDQYEDFELYLEWAISEGGNSGIFYHVLEGDYNAAYATGPEYQLIDDIGFPYKLEEWQKAGADYAMYNADTIKKHLKPVGEFNSSRIKVKDGKVTHWLNGEEVLSFEIWTDDWFERVEISKWKDYPGYGRAKMGYIGLQDHGNRIYFKNIKIRDLTNKGVSLIDEAMDDWILHGEGNWYVEDDMLIGANPEGGAYSYLATKESYDNFILRLEFMFEGEGNSGVFFRSVLDGTDITGWQAEVAPPGENTGGIYESGGRGWLAEIPDEKEDILKPGDWNHMLLLVNGGKVITWLNGEMMICIEDEKIAEGNGVIALQLHSGTEVKVKWKNIFIEEL